MLSAAAVIAAPRHSASTTVEMRFTRVSMGVSDYARRAAPAAPARCCHGVAAVKGGLFEQEAPCPIEERLRSFGLGGGGGPGCAMPFELGAAVAHGRRHAIHTGRVGQH